MEITKGSSIIIAVLLFVSCLSLQANAYYYRQCSTKGTRCYGKYIRCPNECPSSESTDPKAKVANQTAMHQDQVAMTLVSLVGMGECSTSTERPMNTLP
ncbi:hypothetical protein VNO80_25634 [Phaseolus coccineus]|uniref:Uncharacterized protein n=1 Tax=Phaseolus coccineus TaxID=3886 RepID=A0AAN9QTJ3_PHACN